VAGEVTRRQARGKSGDQRRRDHGDKILLQQRLGQQRGRQECLGRGDQGRVQAASRHVADHLGGIAGGDGNDDARKRRLDRPERRGQQADAGGGAGAQPQMAAIAVAEAASLIGHAGQRR